MRNFKIRGADEWRNKVFKSSDVNEHQAPVMFIP